VLEIKEYNRDRTLNEHKESNMSEKTLHPKQEEKLSQSDIKNIIQNVVTKTMKDLSKKQTSQKTVKPYICYLCSQKSHIVKNCSN
ncbi:17694_t:CDS:2, partial [Cetraspora pellucida]